MIEVNFNLCLGFFSKLEAMDSFQILIAFITLIKRFLGLLLLEFQIMIFIVILLNKIVFVFLKSCFRLICSFFVGLGGFYKGILCFICFALLFWRQKFLRLNSNIFFVLGENHSRFLRANYFFFGFCKILILVLSSF